MDKQTRSALNKQYRLEHLEYFKEYSKTYYQNNKEKRKKYYHDYYLTHKGKNVKRRYKK